MVRASARANRTHLRMGGDGAGGPDWARSPALLSMAARVGDEDGWWRWRRQVERTGFCSNPVRVVGGAAAVDTSTGEVRAEWSSAGEPDGALLLACKDRRAAVCPSCAETYRADTWHVIAAGLRGRAVAAERPGTRGAVTASVPESVADHPVVLATFTAPSFGGVHRATGAEGVCRARSGSVLCRHRLPVSCNRAHAHGDELVGQPLCAACYDYTAHVLWHTAVPELWRRTAIYAYRALARLLGERDGVRVSVRAVQRSYRISYVKVAEYQKRGAVHLHVIARLDGIDPGDPDRVVPPPVGGDAALLEAALREAAGRVAVPLPAVYRTRTAVWGGQLDVRPVSDGARTAAYLAKYATKTAGDVLAGLPARRSAGMGDSGWLRRRGCSAHVRLLVAECLKLARRPDCAELRLAESVHMLGFRGHFSTRSRRYSITLGALRLARQAWRSLHPGQSPREGLVAEGTVAAADPWAAAAGGDDGVVLVGEWRYVGSGFARLGDEVLAATLARDHATARETRREREAETALRREQAGIEIDSEGEFT